jgi:hypothetical protein
MEHLTRSGKKYRRGLIPMAMSLALPMCNRSVETNLFAMRTVIDEYTFDKHEAPQTVNDLVSARYLDPKAQAWRSQDIFRMYDKVMSNFRDARPSYE